METFLSLAGQFFKGLIKVIEIIFSGIISIMSEYPKFSAGVIGCAVFMYCLRYVPGFGDMAAQVIALILVLAAFGVFKKKKS